MELHALTLAARSYALLLLIKALYYTVVSGTENEEQMNSGHSFNGTRV